MRIATLITFTVALINPLFSQNGLKIFLPTYLHEIQVSNGQGEDNFTYKINIKDSSIFHQVNNEDTCSISKHKNLISTIDFLAFDKDLTTTWISPVIKKDSTQELSLNICLENIQLTSIYIVNGMISSKKWFKQYSRIKQLKLSINGYDLGILQLSDEIKIQEFQLEFPAHYDSMNLKFEILETFKGRKFNRVALSEIAFAHLKLK